ncbi:hypothetical protein HXX76_011691 [Chlamydomonas incerta]|uniref:Protein kinase domain-containing protein n=1 Tax=Chlamydomonas incerta TaxID=51695 RepID=A0A835VVA7_CHLIN|nr:hypothetical protein HXX76_011691 [Chlamydomonas incerta]|eukprot:KAG2426461.1 hypothetical protein HXX76_011691 [Chlamydomonas incerta]
MRQALTWLLDVAEALAFLHASSPTVIHRDIKAENVLLQSEGGPGGGGRMVAKLADLGLHVKLGEDRTVMLRMRAAATAAAADVSAFDGGGGGGYGGGYGGGDGGGDGGGTADVHGQPHRHDQHQQQQQQQPPSSGGTFFTAAAATGGAAGGATYAAAAGDDVTSGVFIGCCLDGDGDGGEACDGPPCAAGCCAAEAALATAVPPAGLRCGISPGSAQFAVNSDGVPRSMRGVVTCSRGGGGGAAVPPAAAAVAAGYAARTNTAVAAAPPPRPPPPAALVSPSLQPQQQPQHEQQRPLSIGSAGVRWNPANAHYTPAAAPAAAPCVVLSAPLEPLRLLSLAPTPSASPSPPLLHLPIAPNRGIGMAAAGAFCGAGGAGAGVIRRHSSALHSAAPITLGVVREDSLLRMFTAAPPPLPTRGGGASLDGAARSPAGWLGWHGGSSSSPGYPGGGGLLQQWQGHAAAAAAAGSCVAQPGDQQRMPRDGPQQGGLWQPRQPREPRERAHQSYRRQLPQSLTMQGHGPSQSQSHHQAAAATNCISSRSLLKTSVPAAGCDDERRQVQAHGGGEGGGAAAADLPAAAADTCVGRSNTRATTPGPRHPWLGSTAAALSTAASVVPEEASSPASGGTQMGAADLEDGIEATANNLGSGDGCGGRVLVLATAVAAPAATATEGAAAGAAATAAGAADAVQLWPQRQQVCSSTLEFRPPLPLPPRQQQKPQQQPQRPAVAPWPPAAAATLAGGISISGRSSGVDDDGDGDGDEEEEEGVSDDDPAGCDDWRRCNAGGHQLPPPPMKHSQTVTLGVLAARKRAEVHAAGEHLHHHHPQQQQQLQLQHQHQHQHQQLQHQQHSARCKSSQAVACWSQAAVRNTGQGRSAQAAMAAPASAAEFMGGVGGTGEPAAGVWQHAGGGGEGEPWWLLAPQGGDRGDGHGEGFAAAGVGGACWPPSVPAATAPPRCSSSSANLPHVSQRIKLESNESISSHMRRLGSITALLGAPASGKLPEHEAFDWVYGLTGQAGSCCYMAPEVFLQQPYNEKADVFSFGVLMYELWAGELLLITYLNTSRAAALGIHCPRDYAQRVSEGFRPPRPHHFSEAQWELVCRCWHQDPCERPSMAEVAAALHVMDLAKKLERRHVDLVHTQQAAAAPPPACGCGCAIS